MAETKNLTAQQRAVLFGASTRQHWQMVGSQTIQGGSQTVEFSIPKARILQGMKVRASGKLNVKGSSNKALTTYLSPYKLFRLVTVDFNNGFRPVAVAGDHLALTNMLYPNADLIANSADGKTLCKMPATLTASTSGSDNAFEFVLDIPLAINQRDPVSLILAQNAETSITVKFDVAPDSAIIDGASGYTCELKDVKLELMAETFSVPADARCWPDFSVLKILDSRNETIVTGLNTVKIPTGMIYRKMILLFEDSSGAAFSDTDITSNIEIVMNTADVPYSISPTMLRAIDKQMLGFDLPKGVYAFSFDYQGIPGYGGSRDLIDAERISELAIRFTSAKSGKFTLVSEKLSRLIANS